MLEANSKESLVLLQYILGDWLVIPAFLFTYAAFNFMFVRIKGIQYLDKEFSPEKKYDDTLASAAGYRFFGYCRKYMLGKIKTKNIGLRVWMWFNSTSYAVSMLLLIYMLFFCFYKWILEF